MFAKFYCILLLTLPSFVVADVFLPEVIYQLDARFTHHVLVVEKSTHKLYLYENAQENPKLVKTYKIATGKITGNKNVQGDKKTPEGIYFFKRFISGEKLVSNYGKAGLIYGAGAFTMNYPNIIDRQKGKTGGGIWLHSTHDDKRVSKGLDSKGCVVATDNDIKDISKFIDIQHTPIIVTQNLRFLKKETWLNSKNEILNTVINWATAWKTKNFPKYIDQYSKKDFKSKNKGNYTSYKNYKRKLFKKLGTPVIKFTNISILNFNKYAIVTMEQDYKSNTISDVGKKTLYMKRNNKYQWKIISEDWKKIQSETLAFTPTMRYFTKEKEASNDPGSI